MGHKSPCQIRVEFLPDSVAMKGEPGQCLLGWWLMKEADKGAATVGCTIVEDLMVTVEDEDYHRNRGRAGGAPPRPPGGKTRGEPGVAEEDAPLARGVGVVLAIEEICS
jgi:hypothetical protein